MTNGGQQYVFGKRLDAVFGEGTAEKVVDLSNTLRKFSTQEIRDMREEIVKRG